MTNVPTAEMVDRLLEIKDEIKELVGEAQEIVKGTRAEVRATAYWYPHILLALDKESEYLGASMCTMQDTIDELTEEAESEDEDTESEVEESNDEDEEKTDDKKA